MKKNVMEQVREHLEWLGCQVECMKDNENFVIATHEIRGNCAISAVGDESIVMRKFIDLSDNFSITEDFLKNLNTLNKESIFNKWVYTEHDGGSITLTNQTFIFNYSKRAFGFYWDALDSSVHKFRELWVEKIK